MGTPASIKFVIDGQTKSSYNHYDGYPEGVGAAVVEWLTKEYEADPELILAAGKARALTQVNASDNPTQTELRKLGGTQYWENVSGGSDWYAFLRATQGNPELILNSGFIAGEGDQGYDYTINFDTRTFEYSGYSDTQKSWSFDKLPSKKKFLKKTAGEDD